MKSKLAIVTVHAGDIKNLIITINSVNSQKIKPDLHLIISKNFNPSILLNRKKYNKFIFNKDKSIYNAMNLGLKHTKNYSLIFLNSGDYLYSKNSIELIKTNLKLYNKKCLIFKTILKYGKKTFLVKNKIFNMDNFFSHPSFVRPPVSKIIYFDENFKILSDGNWMLHNKKLFGSKKIKNITTVHNLGGVSSNPTFYSIKDNFRFSFYSGIKELLKFFLNIFFKRKSYYEIIFRKNYLIK